MRHRARRSFPLLESCSAMKITVEIHVMAPLERVWAAWITPEDILCWHAASEDWRTTFATVDLREGGEFRSRMEARDGSVGFDFAGIYTRIEPRRLIAYTTLDERQVIVEFIEATAGRVLVRQTVEAERVHASAHQGQGWQAILDSFARYLHGHVGGARAEQGGRG